MSDREKQDEEKDGSASSTSAHGPSPSFETLQEKFKDKKLHRDTDVDENNKSKLPLNND